MTQVIAVTNHKGGVGKTTTSVNLAASLSAVKRKVLLVDMDPQGNATMGSGVNKNSLEQTVCDVILGDANINDCIHYIKDSGFAVLPANGDLTVAEVELMNSSNRERRLRDVLEQVKTNYDYVIVDCPPSLNMLTLNALVAADGVLIPMQCEYYALEGLSALVQTIEQVRGTVNPNLRIEGLLRTMFDPRNKLANDVSDQLIQHFGDQVYRTIVPRNVRLAEAPSHGLPVLTYDKTSRGALAYFSLAGEIIQNHVKAGTIPAGAAA